MNLVLTQVSREPDGFSGVLRVAPGALKTVAARLDVPQLSRERRHPLYLDAVALARAAHRDAMRETYVPMRSYHLGRRSGYIVMARALKDFPAPRISQPRRPGRAAAKLSASTGAASHKSPEPLRRTAPESFVS